jgi:hypothetical protein
MASSDSNWSARIPSSPCGRVVDEDVDGATQSVKRGQDDRGTARVVSKVRADHDDAIPVTPHRTRGGIEAALGTV